MLRRVEDFFSAGSIVQCSYPTKKKHISLSPLPVMPVQFVTLQLAILQVVTFQLATLSTSP
jgi:hypothetical protein